MALGDPTNRNTAFTLTSPSDNSPVSLSVPVVTAGSKIQAITVQYAAPECSLIGVTLNNSADGAATTMWNVKGKAGQTYRVVLAVGEQDTN